MDHNPLVIPRTCHRDKFTLNRKAWHSILFFVWCYLSLRLPPIFWSVTYCVRSSAKKGIIFQCLLDTRWGQLFRKFLQLIRMHDLPESAGVFSVQHPCEGMLVLFDEKCPAHLGGHAKGLAGAPHNRVLKIVRTLQRKCSHSMCMKNSNLLHT